MKTRTAWLHMLFIFSMLIVMTPERSSGQSAAEYDVLSLISNSPVWAMNFDSSLLDPQGLARTPDGPWRVADEAQGRITPYDGNGASFPGLSPLIIALPDKPGSTYDHPSPTGIVYNGTKDFELAPGQPAEFLVATRDGTIEGWNRGLSRDSTVVVKDNSSGAAYTGITIAQGVEGSRLYAANFRQQRVDVFDADFLPLLLSGDAFTDPALPDGYAPYNIQNIKNLLYVTFAAEAGDSRLAVPGEGAGYVDVFDTEGELVAQLEHGPWMNAPWGMAQAPGKFGEYRDHLLVGNTGSGTIATFDLNSGLFAGFLAGRGGAPIIIAGLHGLGFGNDGLAGPSDTLYFTAGFRGSEPNLFGSIKLVSLPQTGPASDMITGPVPSLLY